LATGGTACAAAELVGMANAEVIGFSFLSELTFLNGRENLKKYSEHISTFVSY
jgi:adenine phosphoribosyltransferase